MRFLSRANIATFLTSAAIQGCGVITGIVTARTLGPSARGELATVILWPTIFANLGLVGCNWAVARAVAGDPERESDWARASAVLAFFLACGFFALGFFTVPYLLPADKQGLTWLTRVCLLLIPLDVFNQILLATEHGRMRWTRYNSVRASFYVFYAVLVCVVWLTGHSSVTYFVAVFLFSHFLGVTVRVSIQWKTFVSGRLRLPECWHLFRAGVPFLWSTASNLITLQLDKVLVVGFMNTEAVGLYAAAITFSNAHSALGEAFGITSFAVLANENSVEQQGRILSRTFRQATLTALALGSVLACIIPFTVKLMFGADFTAAVAPAIVLTLSASLTACANILNQGLKGAGRPYPGLVSQLVGTGGLACAVFLLAPRLTLIGMAWAVVVSSVIQVLTLVLSASSLLRISPLSFWALNYRDLRAALASLNSLRLRYVNPA